MMTNKSVPARKPYDFSCSKDIVSLERVDKVKITDSKTGSYVIEPEVVETSRIPTQEYVDSFKDEVGIENIFKQFLMTGDESLLCQRSRSSVPIGEDGKELVQDYSSIPTDYEEAIAVAKAAQEGFKSLPAELVNNRSFMEFAETCSEAELIAYVQSLKAQSDGGNQ